MRIISGQWRGRRLVTPRGDATRPTADRVRETLFSMLTSRLGGFSGLRVADLFAGSGALGLEALSRGAASALFVERDRDALAALRTNIAALAAVETDVCAQSVESLGAAPTALDLVMMDPPYGVTDWPAMIDRLIERGWVGAGTLVTIEDSATQAIDLPQLERIGERRVGKAALHIYRSGR
jgi:16S rRNA (guanine966-N2)-methyltransferase